MEWAEEDTGDKMLWWNIMTVNQKGIGPVAVMGLAFLLVILAPIFLMKISGLSKVLFQIIMVFIIIGYVRQMGIEGALMWVVSGILCYFIVYKYIYLFSSLYVLMLMMGFGLTSALMWGSATLRGKLGDWKAARTMRREGMT